ncbi:YncE family protein [Pseudomonas sp. NPDC098740]|uniref:YncE family protein n=1 Tax=Pseudomonas sp. NPDC098740 TaxID=3364486 RepID=UPI00383A2110
MDIQSAVLNELFVLYPVIIQGWITPVLPTGIAQGGIPKALYDGQSAGLECLVDPLTEVRSGTLAVDDRVDLYVNDGPTPVAGKTINPGEEQQRIRLYVPHGELQDGVNTLHYVVTRPGGNGSDKSRVLEVLYHLRAPGEPVPAGMRLQIPAAVREQGVDAGQAAQGVVFGFDYANRRAYDRIRLTLGTVPVDRVVAPGEAGPGLPVVTQTLFTDTFKQSGDNPNTLVFYSVTDQLGNRNTSADEQIDVHLERLTLSPPTLVSPALNPIDPLAYPQGVTVRAEFLAALKGDKARLVEKNPPGGAPAFPLVDFGANKRADFKLDPAFLIARQGKPLEVFWNLNRGGKRVASSDPLPLSVKPIAAEDPRFPTPAIDRASGELDVTNLLPTDQLRVAEWLGHTSGQPVWLRYDGVDANGTAIFFEDRKGEPHTTLPGLNRPVPLEWLKTLKDGSELKVSFKVNFDGVANEAAAVRFPVRTYSVKAAAATVLTFTNDPYLIAPAGRVKNIELSLRTPANQPVPGANVTLELPANVIYADGGSGARDFTTEADGTLTVRGVKGHTTPGTYPLVAVSGQQRASASLTITPQGLVGEIPVPELNDFVYSRDGTRIYACSGVGFFMVIDALTLQVLRTVYVGGDTPYCIAVSPDDTRLYIGLYYSNVVVVIDTMDWSIMVRIPAGSNPRAIALSSDGARAYVLNTTGLGITVIDTELLKPDAFVSIPSSRRFLLGMTISPDNTRVYVVAINNTTNEGPSTLIVVDTQKLEVINRFQIPLPAAEKVIISQDGQRAYIISAYGGPLVVLDTKSGALIKSIPMSPTPAHNGTGGFVFTADGSRLFTCHPVDYFVSNVEVIDTEKLVLSYTLYNCPARTYKIDLSPDDTRLAVGVREKGVVVIATR